MLIYNGVLLFSFRHAEHKRLIEILFNRYQFLLSTHFRMSLNAPCVVCCVYERIAYIISSDFMVIIRLFYSFLIVTHILLAGAY